MGIDGEVKQWILDNFPQAISYDLPENIDLVCIDMMQHLKCSLPESVVTVLDLLKYLVNRVIIHFKRNKRCRVVVANFDLGSPPVKKLVEHVTRHDKRCKKCKSTPDFHADCNRKCRDKKPLKFGEGPYLNSTNLNAELPVRGSEWIRFAMDTRNLRTELYPLLMNELLLTHPPLPNQILILNGLPARTRKLDDFEMLRECGYVPKGQEERVRVVRWMPEELPVPMIEDIFHTVFMIKWLPEGRILVTECPDMKNDIHEADNAVFFFSQFFPGHNHMVSINDGDAIPIGLLRCAEDFRGGKEPTHTTWLQLPFRITNKEKLKRMFGLRTPPRYQYINLSQLYADISGYAPFVRRGVQNPVATFVFLTILGETDFFKKFCPGIGLIRDWSKDEKKRARQTNGIWDTFMGDLEKYSHMVQWYTNDMQHDPSARRRIVLDETLFRLFTYQCYFNKYMPNKPHTHVSDLRIRCSKLKYPLPAKNVIRTWARRVSWNLQYWVNACRDIYTDPFEVVEGLPYWGYTPERVTENVHPLQKPVDRVFKRHFYEQRTKNRGISPAKKRKVAKEMTQEINDFF